MSDQVTKIYELRTLGYDQIKKELSDVAAGFKAIKEAKKSIGNEGSPGRIKEETDAIKEQKAAMQELKLEEMKLKVERQKLTNEAKAANLVRQQEIAQQRQQKASTEAVAGSYNALYKEYRELYNLVKAAPKGSMIDFRGQSMQFDQAISKLKELARAEQDFRRQFARDGLLVGEYTSGIVQAFKQMGLDDIVGGQVQKANQRLQALDNEFKDLRKTMADIKATGVGSFEAIEKQLIDNRKEAIALQQQVGRLENELRSAGDVGDKVTNALGKGFRELKGQVAQFALTYLSFQALLTTGQQTLDTTVQLDSLDSSLKLVSGSTKELAINQEFLRNISERLGLQYLDLGKSFKNFYASSTLAGISAEDTRMIFEAAASASARLKLSQDDTNGVLLAFGQIASKGKVQAEELRGQIGERLPGAFAIAAKAMGVSQQELNKMLETGQVLSSDFLPKFGAELQRTFGGDTTERVEGLQASLNRLRNQFTQLVQSNQAGLTTFFNILIAVAGGFFTLLGYLPQLIAFLGLYATGWALLNRELVIAKARLLLVNAQLIASRVALAAVNVILLLNTIAQKAYTTAILLFTGVQRGATAASILFGNALRLLPIGAVLTVLALLIAAVRAFASTTNGTTAALRSMAIQQELNNEIGRRVADSTTEQISKLQVLSKVAGDNSVSLAGRKKALQELIDINPEYLKGLTLENIRMEDGIGILDRYIKALREKAAVQAAQAIRDEKLQKDTRLELLQFDLEKRIATGKDTGLDELPDDVKEFVGNARKQFAFTASVTDLITGGSAAKEALAAIKLERAKLVQELDATDEIIKKKFTGTTQTATEGISQQVEVNIAELQEGIKRMNNEINSFAGSRAALNKLITERDIAQKKLDGLLNKKSGGGRSGGRTTKANEPFTINMTALDAELKAEREKLEADRAERVITEGQYIQSMATLEQTYFDNKIALYQKYKPKELNEIEALQAERRKKIADSNRQLFEFEEKQLEAELKRSQEAIAEERDRVLNNQASTTLEKAQAKIEADTRLLALQEKFNQDMEALEAQFNAASIENAEERARALRQINQGIATSSAEFLRAQLEDVRQRGRDRAAGVSNEFSGVRRQITQSGGSRRRNAIALEQANNAEARSLLSVEVDSLTQELPIMKRLLDQGLITQEAYLKAETELNNKAAQLQNLTVQNLETTAQKSRSLGQIIQEGFRNLFGIQEGTQLDGLLGNVISQSYDLAKQAMNGYFDAEIQRIRESQQASIERLDLEKQQLLDRAQSREEELSIEKQYQAKKAEEEAKAGERIKKVRKAEAKISLASELASIAVAAAQNPLNGITLGTAGIAMYSLLSALAIGRYALRVNEINRAQFEYGGNVPTDSGGKITGPSHANGGVPFNYEAEGGELAIVRTKNAPSGKRYTITGTHTEIASKLNQLGGGKAFWPGAKLERFDFGGNLGEGLQAPVFNPASTAMPTGTMQEINEVLEVLKEQAGAILAVNGRIDRLRVEQVTTTVTQAQKKQVIQTEIGTL